MGGLREHLVCLQQVCLLQCRHQMVQHWESEGAIQDRRVVAVFTIRLNHTIFPANLLLG